MRNFTPVWNQPKRYYTAHRNVLFLRILNVWDCLEEYIISL